MKKINSVRILSLAIAIGVPVAALACPFLHLNTESCSCADPLGTGSCNSGANKSDYVPDWYDCLMPEGSSLKCMSMTITLTTHYYHTGIPRGNCGSGCGCN